MTVEELLTDALQDRADRTPYDATPMATVALAARRMRRRRRGALVLASAASVAAVTVTVAVVGGGPGSDPGPSDTSSATTATSPATTPAPTPSTSAAPTTTGSGPAIGYVEDHVFQAPQGTPVTLSVPGRIRGLVVLDDGFIVSDTRAGEGTARLTRLDGKGRVVDDLGCGDYLAARGRLVAWVQFTCDYVASEDDGLHLLDLDTGEELVQAGAGGASLTIVGREVAWDDGEGRAVYVSDLVDPPRQVPVLTSLAGATEDGLFAGGTGPGGSSGAVVDLDGDVLWQREDLFPDSVSPDGTYVLARPAGVPARQAQAEIIDTRTGRTVSRVEGSGPEDFPTFAYPVWEDDTHLVGDVVLNCCSAMGRVGLDGALQFVGEISASAETVRLYAIVP